jgi:endonuclease/exonuclease/phosphatase family metal-dependent hydrolase
LLRFATWNCRGLTLTWATDPAKYQEKIKYLKSLTSQVDIVAMQEVHGTVEAMHETFKELPGWLSFCSPCLAPGAGGIAILVRRQLLHQASGILPRTLHAGRALQVLLQLPSITLNLIALHVDPAAPREAQHDVIRRSLATCDPALHTTILMADLNACMPGDTRINLTNLQAEDHDDSLGQWFAHHFPNLIIAEHDGHTRIGYRDGKPHTLSRIDYVMTDLPKVTALDARFAAHVHGNLLTFRASDHAAVIARLHPPRTSPSNRRMVPSWQSTSSSFKAMVDTLVAQHVALNVGPPSRDDIIEIFYVADARLRAAPPAEPLSPAAQLHWCLVAFRARRQHDSRCLQRALRAHPALPLDTLDAKISELMVQVADAQLHDRQGLGRKAESAGQAYMQKIALWRNNVPRARFMHIITDEDIVITDDSGMASCIGNHWKKVFQGTDTTARHDFHLQSLTASVPPALGLSEIPFDRDDITASLRRQDSAPGPDGICYSAWKAAGQVGIEILHNILLDLWNGGLPPPSFRHSLMVFLPKSDSQAVGPHELRPLALCDSDYKIIMGCINYRLAHHIPDYVDDRQRGFIRGRLGLDNLLLLEAAAMLASRSGAAAPALCFLDIAAAFPSLLHDFLKAVLDKFLGHHPLNHIISTMYTDNTCDIVIRGSVLPGFRVLCGVRQGCPLSGSLFALAFHPIIVSLSDTLYRVSMTIGHDIFAYADDLALVLYEFWRLLPALDQALADVAAGAGLHINWQKVQLIPLWWHADLELIKRRLSATCPRWKPSKLGMTAKYLGILVGPGVSDTDVFAVPLKKYWERCRFIAKLGLGWSRAASLHNIFALPVLSYVAQVQGDDGLREIDLDRAAAILFKNPMYRPPFRFFAHLDELGCTTGIKDVRVECQAALARCSITLSALPQARRQLITGSDDDHLRVHPQRGWQDRCSITRLGVWHDRLRREMSPLPTAPRIQQKCKEHLRSSRGSLAYFELIRDRITPILRRLGDEFLPHLEASATQILDTIILASTNLPCTGIQALLRLSQNAFVLGQTAGVLPCPFCEAEQAARLSHFLRCGAIWLFLDEQCSGLGWDCSSPDRWQLLLGRQTTDSLSAGLLAVVWDLIHAGAQAGRFGCGGVAGMVARLTALSKRPGHMGLLARQLVALQPTAVIAV